MRAYRFREPLLHHQFFSALARAATGAAVLALAGAATVCMAGEASTTAPGTPEAPQAGLTKGEIKAMREFKMLDFDGDGKLSRSEVKLFPRLSAAFDEADTDKDGYVSYEEVRAFAAKYRAERERNKAAQAAQAAQAAGEIPAPAAR